MDLDNWLVYYHEERTHSGKYCFEKTPMQTFRDSIHLAREKQLENLYYPINPMNHSSGVMANDDTFETTARPENSVDLSEKASVHFSLADAEKLCNLAEPVNG